MRRIKSILIVSLILVSSCLCVPQVRLGTPTWGTSSGRVPKTDRIDMSGRWRCELSDVVLDYLNRGGRVLLLPPSQTIKDDEHYPIKMGFSSIFWNTVWTNRQAPHTLGILCNPSHPALAEFPTEYHSNWQWWELMHGTVPFILTPYKHLLPVVQVIDDWVTARKLALVFEARVGNGKLVACSCDLVSELNNRPVARQMRHSLLAYMSGDLFEPQYRLTVEQLSGLLK